MLLTGDRDGGPEGMPSSRRFRWCRPITDRVVRIFPSPGFSSTASTFFRLIPRWPHPSHQWHREKSFDYASASGISMSASPFRFPNIQRSLPSGIQTNFQHSTPITRLPCRPIGNLVSATKLPPLLTKATIPPHFLSESTLSSTPSRICKILSRKDYRSASGTTGLALGGGWKIEFRPIRCHGARAFA